MDSGLLHLAGTTDAEIIQLGSSINPEFRAPYRNGSQSYRYHYVKGPCNLFCASNLKYSLRDWEYGYSGGTPIQSVPLIDTCLERKETMECHPSDTQVFNTIEKILSSGVTEIVNEVIDENKENKDSGILVKIASKSLGDQIGAIAAIGTLSLNNNVTVLCDLGYSYFKESYPDINFISSGIDPELDTLTGEWLLEGKRYSKFKIIHYKFDKPLIKGYADQLGVNTWERPKIDFKAGSRPIKNKYVCFSMHSTAQAKHWNYPNGWQEIVDYLNSIGYKSVLLSKEKIESIVGVKEEKKATTKKVRSEKNKEKVEIEDIDKKLDEILSE
jgi:hypothetical protein